MLIALKLPAGGLPTVFFSTLTSLLDDLPDTEVIVVTPVRSSQRSSWSWLLRQLAGRNAASPFTKSLAVRAIGESEPNSWEKSVALWIEVGAPSPKLKGKKRWRLVLGLSEDEQTVPAGYWELKYGASLVRLDLLATTDGANSVIIGHSTLRTIPYSLRKTRLRVYEYGAKLIVNALKRYRHNGFSIRSGSPWHSRSYSRQIGNALFFSFQRIPQLWKKVIQKYLLRELWCIGIIEAKLSEFLVRPDHYQIKWFPQQNQGALQADPFVLQTTRGAVIYYEHMDFISQRGRINSIEYVDFDFEPPAKTKLERPVHLSFPFTFRYRDGLYCVPEASRGNDVSLYKFEPNTEDWNKLTTLVPEFPGTDPAIAYHNDLWWLLCTRQGTFDLYIWYADQLLGEWRPHYLNPVVSDVRYARNAGRLISHRGNLYRPVQDCSKSYGGRIVINRVEVLSPVDFLETPGAVLEPDRSSPYHEGFHTVTGDGDYTVVDGKRMIFTLLPLLGRFGPLRFSGNRNRR